MIRFIKDLFAYLFSFFKKKEVPQSDEIVMGPYDPVELLIARTKADFAQRAWFRKKVLAAETCEEIDQLVEDYHGWKLKHGYDHIKPFKTLYIFPELEPVMRPRVLNTYRAVVANSYSWPIYFRIKWRIQYLMDEFEYINDIATGKVRTIDVSDLVFLPIEMLAGFSVADDIASMFMTTMGLHEEEAEIKLSKSQCEEYYKVLYYPTYLCMAVSHYFKGYRIWDPEKRPKS